VCVCDVILLLFRSQTQYGLGTCVCDVIMPFVQESDAVWLGYLCM